MVSFLLEEILHQVGLYHGFLIHGFQKFDSIAKPLVSSPTVNFDCWTVTPPENWRWLNLKITIVEKQNHLNQTFTLGCKTLVFGRVASKKCHWILNTMVWERYLMYLFVFGIGMSTDRENRWINGCGTIFWNGNPKPLKKRVVSWGIYVTREDFFSATFNGGCFFSAKKWHRGNKKTLGCNGCWICLFGSKLCVWRLDFMLVKQRLKRKTDYMQKPSRSCRLKGNMLKSWAGFLFRV